MEIAHQKLRHIEDILNHAVLHKPQENHAVLHKSQELITPQPIKTLEPMQNIIHLRPTTTDSNPENNQETFSTSLHFPIKSQRYKKDYDAENITPLNDIHDFHDSSISKECFSSLKKEKISLPKLQNNLSLKSFLFYRKWLD